MAKQNIFQRIAGWFKDLKAFLANIIPSELDEVLDRAEQFAQLLKKALESDTAVAITEWTPTFIDDFGRAKAVEALDWILRQLKNDPCADVSSPEERLNCYLNWLRTAATQKERNLAILGAKSLFIEHATELKESQADFYALGHYIKDKK